jgi:hypothetical protein
MPTLTLGTRVAFEGVGSDCMVTGDLMNFQPTDVGKAADSTGGEPVLHALRASGIEVTALHNPTLDNEP